MKGKVVTIIVLVVLIWSGNLAALAQAGPSPADGPQRASSRERHVALHGPAPMQGGSLERRPRSHRAHSDSSITVKSSEELSNPGRQTVMAPTGGRRDCHSALHGPAPMQGGSLERWPRSRRVHSDLTLTVKSTD